MFITIDSLYNYIALGLRSIWRPNPWIDPAPILLHIKLGSQLNDNVPEGCNVESSGNNSK